MFDPDDGYVLIDDAAQQMGLTVNQVSELVRRRVLRGDDVWVQPALISGAIQV